MSQPPYGGQYDPQSGQPYGQQPYGQPSGPPAYGDPGAYGQPSGPPYGQPSGPPYGQPSGPPYGQPSGPPYGQSAPGTYGAPAGGQVQNNLGKSIAALILFWPLGLIALLAANKVNDLVAQGNVGAAQEEAEKANKFSKYAFITAGIWWGLWVIGCCVWVIIGAAAGSSSSY